MAPVRQMPKCTHLVLSTAYTIVALIITIFRLVARRFDRWWYDDLFAFVGVIAIVLQCIVLWLRIQRVPILMANHTASIAFFYLNSMCLYLEDWMARLSILYSIIRIAPSELTKFRLKLSGILFFLAMVVNGILLVATCEKDTSWHSLHPPRCYLEETVPIYRIVTGILSDTVLVVMPIRILRGLKSAPRIKRRLIILFLASLLMTAACIAQGLITIILPGGPELIASLTEGFTALVTCNLTILVMAVIRLISGKSALEEDIGRTGFTRTPSDIEFKTLSSRGGTSSIRGVAKIEPDPDPPNLDTHSGTSGMMSIYTTNEGQSSKSIEDGEVLDIRPMRTFIDRWRTLDVDEL